MTVPNLPPCPVDPACSLDHSHTTLNPSRTRRELLRAVGNRRLRLTPGGAIIRQTENGLNRRCDKAVRELEAAGWVRLARDGGTYELTGAGRAVLDGAR